MSAMRRLDVKRWDPWRSKVQIPTAAVILLDGVPMQRVRRFDVEAGWVETLCTDGHCGYPGQAHVHPDKPEEVCVAPLHRGRVEVFAP
jgi:hypothetical protein